MTTIHLDVPDEILWSLKEAPDDVAREIRMAAAAKLYEFGPQEPLAGEDDRLDDVDRLDHLPEEGEPVAAAFEPAAARARAQHDAELVDLEDAPVLARVAVGQRLL